MSQGYDTGPDRTLTHSLTDLVPEQAESGGRPRDYPTYMWLLYEALISVYGSARRVEAELAHPVVWNLIRTSVRKRFPNRPDLQLPVRPMRRHHCLYARNRYLTDPTILNQLANTHRELAAEQARSLGLLDPDGAGSWTHPDLSRMVHADGKIITPLFKAKPDDHRVDRHTGEILPTRYEPDAALHFEGDGNAAWGTKFVLVAARHGNRGPRRPDGPILSSLAPGLLPPIAPAPPAAPVG